MRYRTSCVTGAGVSGSIWDGSGNAATTIDSGLSEAAVVSVAVPVTGSAAVATSAPAAAAPAAAAPAAAASAAAAPAAAASAALATAALATAALAIAIACGSSASLALAAREAAPFSIGTAPVFSVPAEPKPATQPTMTPARTSDPQTAGPTVVNRGGLMIPSPPNAPPKHAAQPSTRLADFSDQDMTAQWRKLQAHQFFQKVLPECNAPPASNRSPT